MMCLKEGFGPFHKISDINYIKPIDLFNPNPNTCDEIYWQRKGSCLLIINNLFYSDHETVRQMWGNCLELINIWSENPPFDQALTEVQRSRHCSSCLHDGALFSNQQGRLSQLWATVWSSLSFSPTHTPLHFYYTQVYLNVVMWFCNVTSAEVASALIQIFGPKPRS